MKQVTRGHSPPACTQQQQVSHEQAVGPVGTSSRRRGDAPPVTAGAAGAEAPVASRVSSVRLRPVGPPHGYASLVDTAAGLAARSAPALPGSDASRPARMVHRVVPLAPRLGFPVRQVALTRR